MCVFSEDIFAKCIDAREEESESEVEKKPTGGSGDSSKVGVDVPLRSAEVVVDEVPPPPPESQCIQDSEETKPPGPPGLVDCEREQQDELMDDVSATANDFE